MGERGGISSSTPPRGANGGRQVLLGWGLVIECRSQDGAGFLFHGMTVLSCPDTQPALQPFFEVTNSYACHAKSPCAKSRHCNMIALLSHHQGPFRRGDSSAPTELLLPQSGQTVSIQHVRRTVRERHLDQARTKSGLQVRFGKVLAVGQTQNIYEFYPAHFSSQGRNESFYMGGYLRGDYFFLAREGHRQRSRANAANCNGEALDAARLLFAFIP